MKFFDPHFSNAKRTPAFLAATGALLTVLAACFPSVATAKEPNRTEVLREVDRQATVTLGTQRGDYFLPDKSIRQTLHDAIAFDGDELAEMNSLANGVYLITGCRKDSCEEKGAAIIDMRGHNLVAVGLRHFHCRLSILTEDQAKSFVYHKEYLKTPSTCDKKSTLTVILFRRPSQSPMFSAENRYVETIRKWGQRAGYESEEIKVMEVQ